MIGSKIILTSESFLWKNAYEFEGDMQSKVMKCLLFVPAWGMSILAIPFKIFGKFFKK